MFELRQGAEFVIQMTRLGLAPGHFIVDIGFFFGSRAVRLCRGMTYLLTPMSFLAAFLNFK